MSMKHLLRKYRKLDVAIEPLPPRKVGVVLNGDLDGFFRYKVGDRFLWVDYDYPGPVVKQYYDGETRSRFWVNGEDCLELHFDFYELKNGRFRLESESDKYVAVRDRDIAGLLWIHREADAPVGKSRGNIQIGQIVTPRGVRLGERWQFTDRWFWKGAKGEQRIAAEANGLFRVRVFDREYKTLRIREVKLGKKGTLADCYVALDTGLSVFFRRYNGPGWKNLDKLANEEKVVIGKTAFLHWYDSVPFRE